MYEHESSISTLSDVPICIRLLVHTGSVVATQGNIKETAHAELSDTNPDVIAIRGDISRLERSIQHKR